MSERKTVEELEKEENVVLPNANLKDKMTVEEFRKMCSDEKVEVVGVHHEDRVKFLKDNGYAVTRENMVNSELSAQPKD